MYVHVGNECDGRWVKAFNTEAEARTSIKAYAIIDESDALPRRGVSYHSDIGGTHSYHRLPPITHATLVAAQFESLLDAFDSRECGTLTAAQVELLARVEPTYAEEERGAAIPEPPRGGSPQR